MERKLPSKEILDLAREIQMHTGKAVFSYQEPAPEYIMKALLVWLDDYTRPRQESLLPDIQLDDERK